MQDCLSFGRVERGDQALEFGEIFQRLLECEDTPRPGAKKLGFGSWFCH